MAQIKFPESFTEIEHPLKKGAKQWILSINGENRISIVGGGVGLYGNGITTFEYWDFYEDSPIGYLSKEEINEKLEKINI